MTFVLNVLFIIYFQPDNPLEEIVCPQIYSFSNGSFNQDLEEEYVIATFVLGSLYAVLAFWLVMEYFMVTWPHFVLPRFLYTIGEKLKQYRLTSPIAK